MRRQQGRQHDRQIERLLPVQPLQQGKDDAGGEHAGRGPIGRIQAAAQAQRQHQQRQPGEAAEEMRQLDQGQRRQWAQPVQPIGHCRRGTRDQQHDAADEHQRRQQRRQDQLRPAAGEVQPLDDDPAGDIGLVQGEDDGRQQQRQHVVDQPVDHEGAATPGACAASGNAISSTASNTPRPAGTWLITPAMLATV